MIKKTIYILKIMTLLASPLLMGGCGETTGVGNNGPDENIPVEVNFTLTALGNTPGTSRGDGTPVNPLNANEKINDWFMVFVDATNKVSKILTREEARIGNSAGPVEEEAFKCILPSGTYTVYAFANISPSELSAATGGEDNGIIFTEGLPNPLTGDNMIWNGLDDTDGKLENSSVPNGVLYDVNVSGVSNNNLNLWDIDSKAIPMTGIKNITVRNTAEETFSIEVVRMMAKVVFEFQNLGDTDVTVHSISIDPVTVSAVSLFPDYGAIGTQAYTELENSDYARLTYTPSSPLTVSKSTSSSIPTATFYIKESLSGNANDGAFTVWLNLSHNGSTGRMDQYNLTKDIKGYINRNDLIEIPIALSEYDVKAEALFYPPIGGYPAFLSTTDIYGSQVFTFGTEGDFIIIPKVINKNIGEELEGRLYKITNLSISDPSGIFSKSPALSEVSSALPTEIVGTVKDIKGKATVDLTVEIYDKPYATSGAQKIRSYSRSVDIVRDDIND